MHALSWNTIFNTIILVLIHWTIFMTDVLLNNFFPFSQIFGSAVHNDIIKNTYKDLNYTYSCTGVAECSQKLCLASQVPLANRVILIPITTTNNCNLPNDIWIYIMIAILIIELLFTLLWINKCSTCLLNKQSGLILSMYVVINLIILFWGPIAFISIITSGHFRLLIVFAFRLVLLVVTWGFLWYNISVDNMSGEDNKLETVEYNYSTIYV